MALRRDEVPSFLHRVLLREEFRVRQIPGTYVGRIGVPTGTQFLDRPFPAETIR